MKGLGSTLGKVAGTGLKVFSAGVGAAAAGISALGTAAINSYADYEQLVGGVETLFKDSADIVSEYADNAYKSAGLSANAYMETVTSFSASLLQSLDGDTAAAAEAANQAVIDMSDNANKMGSSMESIQNAYQGFAKQNYTMLDNLKLGYGGTKEEMERLLADATALTGVEYDIDSLNDVYSAIHVIQTELGITGTTAKEASTTISGSVNAMKASWSNLVTGIADDSQDFDALIDNFVESVGTVADNILPRVEVVLVGIGYLVEELLPIIVERIPEIINSVLPNLLQSGMNMISTLLSGIQANLPEIIQGAIAIIQQFTTSFIEMLPQILEMGLQLIVQLALGIAQALPDLIPQIVSVMLTIVDTLLNNIDLLLDAAVQLIIGLAVGLIDALPVLIEKAPAIIMKLAEAFINATPQLLRAALAIITEIANALITYVPKLLAKIPQIMTSIKNKFLEFVSGFADIGKNIIDGIWNGISAGWNWLTEKVGSLASGLFEAAKGALGIHSPSRKFKYLAEMCVAGFDEGMEELMSPQDMTRNINASMASIQAGIASSRSGSTSYGSINQTININREVRSPDEIARAIRLESRYGLMGGVAIG